MDEKIILALNGINLPWVDALMLWLSNRLVWIPLYVLLIALVIRRMGWKRGLWLVAACCIAVGLTDYVCASLVRPQVARLRPISPANPFSEMIRVIPERIPRSYSFPSCHAANSFAVATFMSLVFRRGIATFALYFWALMITVSRAFLAVHYPTDLLAGAVIGSAIAALMWLGANQSMKRWIPVAVVLMSGFMPARAEKVNFEWGGEFASIFDNREGGGAHTPAETYFITRLAPEIGFSVGQHREHKVMGGVVWTQPIGCEWDGHRVSPTLYYRYEGAKVHASMGMFPRNQLLEPLPDWVASDSTRYFQHMCCALR